jgi:biofilm PGA synthesis N-glycosyltransferase PgaC
MIGRRLADLLLVTIAASGHVLYPAWLLASTRGSRLAPPRDPADWPSVTVIVPAYRESAVIADKVADAEANGYPGALETLVVADDADTARAARTAGARVLAPGRRIGKAAAINAGVAAARGAIVVLSDANARLAPGSLAAMARWFALPDVTGVAGEKKVLGAGESLYWRFESALKRAEARHGTTIGLVGELAAVRRERFRPLPAELAVDDLWLALDLIEDGGRVVYEPAAVAFEDPSETLREVWERRTRVVSGVIDVCVRRRALLAPWRGLVAAELWGHRLLRSTAAPLAHMLLLARAAGRARTSRVARAVVGAHALMAAAIWRQRAGRPLTAAERPLAEVGFLQLVALGGLWRYVRGDRPALWPKADRSAER